MTPLAERAVLVTLLLTSALETRPSLAKDQAPIKRELWTLDHSDEGYLWLSVKVAKDPDPDFDEDFIIDRTLKMFGHEWTFEHRFEDWLNFSAPNEHSDFKTYDRAEFNAAD